jgi:hypothetical protein
MSHEQAPSAQENDEPKFGEYKEDPEKIFYHGSSEDYELDPEKTDPLFGGELYVTDHVSRAAGHVIGEHGKLHELKLKLKKVFEFDKVSTLDEVNEIREAAGLSKKSEDEWEPTTNAFVHGSIINELNKGLTSEERESGAGSNKLINDALRKAGYDAIRSPQASSDENVWRILKKDAFEQVKEKGDL